MPMELFHEGGVQARSGCGHRSAYISLPDNGAIHSVERIHIVRFGGHNDHWAARTALDVKRLRVNVAYDRTVEIQVARQVGGSRLREGRIDIKAISRNVVVILANVDLRIRWYKCAQHTCSDKRRKWKIRFSKIYTPFDMRPLLSKALPIIK